MGLIEVFVKAYLTLVVTIFSVCLFGALFFVFIIKNAININTISNDLVVLLMFLSLSVGITCAVVFDEILRGILYEMKMWILKEKKE